MRIEGLRNRSEKNLQEKKLNRKARLLGFAEGAVLTTLPLGFLAIVFALANKYGALEKLGYVSPVAIGVVGLFGAVAFREDHKNSIENKKHSARR